MSERPRPVPEPTDLTRLSQAVAALHREIQTLHMVLDHAQQRPPVADWLPGRELTIDTVPPAVVPAVNAPTPVERAIPQEAEPAAPSSPRAEATVPLDAPATAQPERERITLAGRVGTEPRFRSSPKTHQLIATFALATHPDPETTQWHTIVVFGTRAESLRDSLHPGEEIAVIGYPHTREVRDQRTGELRTRVEVYATAIRRARTDAAGNSQPARAPAPRRRPAGHH